MFPDAPIGSGFAHPCLHVGDRLTTMQTKRVLPVSIVQMSWRGMSDIPSKQYASDDLVGAPSVFGANSSFYQRSTSPSWPILAGSAGATWPSCW